MPSVVQHQCPLFPPPLPCFVVTPDDNNFGLGGALHIPVSRITLSCTHREIKGKGGVSYPAILGF